MWAVGVVVLGAFMACAVIAEDAKPVETAKAPDQGPSTGWKEWLAKGTDPEWLKSQWSKGSELAKNAAASLESVKPAELQRQFYELTKAIEANDFAKVEELAGHLGKVLNAEKFAEGMRFLIIQRQKGGEAAVKAINEFASRKDLNEFERTAAAGLKLSMAVAESDDVRGAIIGVIFFACECKLGAHQGGLLAIPIVAILFPDYSEKLEAHNPKPRQNP